MPIVSLKSSIFLHRCLCPNQASTSHKMCIDSIDQESLSQHLYGITKSYEHSRSLLDIRCINQCKIENLNLSIVWRVSLTGVMLEILFAIHNDIRGRGGFVWDAELQRCGYLSRGLWSTLVPNDGGMCPIHDSEDERRSDGWWRLYCSLEVVQEGYCMLHERTTCEVVLD